MYDAFTDADCLGCRTPRSAAAWYTKTIPFDTGGLGLTRATDFSVADSPGSVAAAAPELSAVMAASPWFLWAYLMELSVAGLLPCLLIRTQAPEQLSPGPLLDRLKRAHTEDYQKEHLKRKLLSATQHLRAKGSITPPGDASEIIQPALSAQEH